MRLILSPSGVILAPKSVYCRRVGQRQSEAGHRFADRRLDLLRPPDRVRPLPPLLDVERVETQGLAERARPLEPRDVLRALAAQVAEQIGLGALRLGLRWA